jgi:hypothetical protein
VLYPLQLLHKHQIAMNFEIEKYNQHSLLDGAKYSVCPICSEHRKKKAQKCLLLDWQKGLGTCQHCGEVVQLHTYKSKNDVFTVQKHKYKERVKLKPIQQTSFIEDDLFKSSLKSHNKNEFCAYLEKLFGKDKAGELIKLYHIGTSKKWHGATVFWQVDTVNKVRGGKVMLYNAHTGKRVKEPFNHITWVHTILKLADFNLNQCLFGEHLLSSNKPIAIVESEKTAVIASAYIPKFTWLAIGSLNNLSAYRCKILEGKTVVLYPDLNGYSLWKEKAGRIEKEINIKFILSDLLENQASKEELVKGLDLADYLTKFQWHEETEPISEELKRLNELIALNPNLSLLIEKLDLVLID